MKILDQNWQRIKASTYTGNTGKKAMSKTLENLTWQFHWKLSLIQISSFLLGLIVERLLIDCGFVLVFFLPKRFPCVHIRADAIKYLFLDYQMLIAKPELYYSNFSSSGRSSFQKSIASSRRELLVKKYEARIQVQVFQIPGKSPATKSKSSHQSLVPKYINHPTFIIYSSQFLISLQYSSLFMKYFQMPYLLQFKDPKSYHLLQTSLLDRILAFFG